MDYPRIVTTSGQELRVVRWLSCDVKSKFAGGRQFADVRVGSEHGSAIVESRELYLEFEDGRRYPFLAQSRRSAGGDWRLSGHINAEVER